MMPRSRDCYSDLSLDRWLAGELAAAEAGVLTRHVESCTFCASRRDALLEARRRFAQEAPPFAALTRTAQAESAGPASGSGPVLRRRRIAGLATSCGLAAAALVAFGVSQAWREAPSDDGRGTFGTRTKGGPASLGWVVRRGERVFAGRPEQPLRPGDAVRFTVSAREPVFVAVLGLGASGKPSVYYPEGSELAPLAAGDDQLLPAAIELDATPGDERFYAVFCESRVPIAAVLGAVERSAQAPALPPGCTGERHTVRVEPP